MIRILFIITLTVSLLGLPNILSAQDVRISEDILGFDIELKNGKQISIQRNQDQNAVIPDAYSLTSRKCPPFCIHPMSAGEGVITVAEIEVLAYLEDVVAKGDGLLIDARAANFFQAGTIPGSINVAYNLFEVSESNPFFESVLGQLGGTKAADGSWDFFGAPKLMLFCNGPWCDQSPQAIQNLLSVGYPADKLFYYRGGIQSWLVLGLNLEEPK